MGDHADRFREGAALASSAFDDLINADEENVQEINESFNEESVETENEAINLTMGSNILHYVRNLPRTQGALGRGLTFNRLMKVMKNENELPESIVNVATYSALTAAQVLDFHAAIINLDTNKTQLMNHLRCAANNTKPSIVVARTPGDSVVANRYALMCHVLVDPRMNQLLVAYHTKLTAAERPSVLTDGAKLTRAVLLQKMLQAINVIKADVTNIFREEHPMLAGMRPEHGEIADTTQLAAMITSMKNAYDILCRNLEASGKPNADGSIGYAVALKFCTHGRTTNLRKFVPFCF